MREAERLHAELVDLIAAKTLPDRMAMALVQAALGGSVRNASYRVSKDVSKNLASRDLKQLMDAGLLVTEGQKRGRYYKPAPMVAQIRQRLRLPQEADDPFGKDGPAQTGRPPAVGAA